ncbi:hypothetical protein RvY_18397 [Ramazzottius varieornatus]|uniref:Uncharacterized protein n=1 Tax=Ramazzottius varieornatus TaxID=947166 RepID=A0A1D1WB70_RAMVA|nr:hypothetical protein RvY_18397 [Ramazzottius varieornatus]
MGRDGQVDLVHELSTMSLEDEENSQVLPPEVQSKKLRKKPVAEVERPSELTLALRRLLDHNVDLNTAIENLEKVNEKVKREELESRDDSGAWSSEEDESDESIPNRYVSPPGKLISGKLVRACGSILSR